MRRPFKIEDFYNQDVKIVMCTNNFDYITNNIYVFRNHIEVRYGASQRMNLMLDGTCSCGCEIHLETEEFKEYKERRIAP